MNAKVINLDIYRRSIVLLQGSKTEIEKWFSEKGMNQLNIHIIRGDLDNSHAITFSDNSDVYICSEEEMDIPTLCHELSHAAFKVLKIVGIDPIESEEAYAYLLEYLVREVISSDDTPLP